MQISRATTGTTFFPKPTFNGLNSLYITIPTGVTAAVKVVGALDPDDSDTYYSVDADGSQVSFDASGSYKTYCIDITGQKYIGIQVDSVSGGAVLARIEKNE